jgi:hypothetical protein
MSYVDWDMAPDWARYVATDANGDVWWHEFEHYIREGDWWANEGRMEKEIRVPSWMDSLEKRPDNADTLPCECEPR